MLVRSIIRHGIRRHVTPSHQRHRWISTSTHTVKEIQIPVPFIKDNIAAKLWESKTTGSHHQSHGKVPPIICLHGWHDNLTSFEGLVPLLLVNRPEQTVLAFDFPGEGQSYHTPGVYSDYHTEGLLTILRIIRHFSWDKVTLLGHSFGGLVGLSFAATFPDLVHQIIGIDLLPRLAAPTEGENQMLITRSCIEGLIDTEAKILKTATRPPASYTREEMIERMIKGRAPHGGLSPAGCDMLIDRGSKKLPDGKLQFNYDPRHLQFFLLALLSINCLPTITQAVTCPTSLISCNPREVALGINLECERIMQNLETNAKPFRHEKIDAGHHVHMLEPQVVAPLINDFLTVHPEKGAGNSSHRLRHF